MKFTKINDFDVIEIEAPPGAPAIVVLHGYGADYRDLAPIATEVHLKRPYHWYFINAPFPCPGLEAFGGRMWFPIDMTGLQNAIAGDQFREFFNSGIPAGLVEARDRLEGLVQKVRERHAQVVLGGFSQGAMVASLTALSQWQSVKGLVILSGTFVAPSLWSDLIAKAELFPVFQSHGTGDPVLPISEARRLKEYLVESGFKHEYHEFNGGHQIPFDVMDALAVFLDGLAEPKS
jgi:phospholipase/carboxylesterase